MAQPIGVTGVSSSRFDACKRRPQEGGHVSLPRQVRLRRSQGSSGEGVSARRLLRPSRAVAWGQWNARQRASQKPPPTAWKRRCFEKERSSLDGASLCSFPRLRRFYTGGFSITPHFPPADDAGFTVLQRRPDNRRHSDAKRTSKGSRPSVRGCRRLRCLASSEAS